MHWVILITLKFRKGLMGTALHLSRGQTAGTFLFLNLKLLRFGGKKYSVLLVKFVKNINKLWLIVRFKIRMYVVLVGR